MAESRTNQSFFPQTADVDPCPALRSLTMDQAPRVIDSYARESKPGDRRQLSVTGQHAVNEKRIIKMGCTLGLRLSDQGRSAWRKGVVRPDWQRMVSRLESGESDGVLIFDIERLLRTIEDALRIVKLAERGMELQKKGLGKGFMVYDSDMEYDLTTVSGQKAFYDQAIAAQTYSFRLSKKVSRGHRQRAEGGEGRMGNVRPLGFEIDGTTVRESEREPLRHVDVMIRVEQKNWRQAVDYMTSQGVYNTNIPHTEECKEKKAALNRYDKRTYKCDCPPKPLKENVLREAMTSPRMAGYTTYRKEIVGELPGEPILDKTDWQELCAVVASKRGRPATLGALCSGSAVPIRCWDCGAALTIVDATRKPTYLTANAQAIREYAPDPSAVRRKYRVSKTMPGPDYPPCGKDVADVHVLDAIITDMIVEILSSTESAEESARQKAAKIAARSTHEAEIIRLEKLRDYWDEQLNNGVKSMTLERHAKLTGDLDKKIAAQQKELTEIGPVAKTLPVYESREAVLSKWDAAEPARRREMFRQAFSERTIYVAPGRTLDAYAELSSRIYSTPKEDSLSDGAL